ncbi:hypothetical protein IID21_04385 [Patescibacteria group bacterium]|nr:hypothetical protein [Patescibacteria group bacterium]
MTEITLESMGAWLLLGITVAVVVLMAGFLSWGMFSTIKALRQSTIPRVRKMLLGYITLTVYLWAFYSILPTPKPGIPIEEWVSWSREFALTSLAALILTVFSLGLRRLWEYLTNTNKKSEVA